MTTEQEIATPAPSLDVKAKMEQLAKLEVELATAKQELEGTPQAIALKKISDDKAAIVGELKDYYKAKPGVEQTMAGHVGFETRRSLSYPPALIREKLPEIAPLIIYEAVDNKALSTLTNAMVKLGRYPEGIHAELEAKADVKETQAWILELAEPTKEGEPEPAEAPKRGANRRKKADKKEETPRGENEAAESKIPAGDPGEESKITVPNFVLEPSDNPAPIPSEPVPIPEHLMQRVADPGYRMSLTKDEIGMALRSLRYPPTMTQGDAATFWDLVNELKRRDAAYVDPMEADVAKYAQVAFPQLEAMNIRELVDLLGQLPADPMQRDAAQEERYREINAEIKKREPGWEDPVGKIYSQPAHTPEPVEAPTPEAGISFNDGDRPATDADTDDLDL